MGEERWERGGKRKIGFFFLFSPLSLLSSLLSLFLVAGGCIARSTQGDSSLIDGVGFIWYERDGAVVARIRNPAGIRSATISVRMWEGEELILDLPPREVPVVKHRKGLDPGLRFLIREQIPPGIDRIEVKLHKVEHDDDLWLE